MDTAAFAELLAIPKLPLYIERVERILQDVVANETPSLRDPALRVIQSTGKRLRPILVIAAAACQGKKIDNRVLTAAAAVELIHIATIVHDDIMDSADVRWGVPTIHRQEGLNSAILVGDYLLGMGAAQAATVSPEVCRVLSTVIATICAGQGLEMADDYNAGRSINDYLATIDKKTAALLAAACQIGGLAADLPAAHIEALAHYGKAFGMAFQLTDDLLDLLSTPEAMGKPVGNDLKEGVYTLPVLLAISGPSSATVRGWLGKQPGQPATVTKIISTLLDDGSLAKTLAEIKKYNYAAVQALQPCGNTPGIAGLAQLPGFYLERALQKQTALPFI